MLFDPRILGPAFRNLELLSQDSILGNSRTNILDGYLTSKMVRKLRGEVKTATLRLNKSFKGREYSRPRYFSATSKEFHL